MSIYLKYAPLSPREALGQSASAANDIRATTMMQTIKYIGEINKQLKAKAMADAIISETSEHKVSRTTASVRVINLDYYAGTAQEVYHELITAFMGAGWDSVRIVPADPSSRVPIIYIGLYMMLEDATPMESGIVDSIHNATSILPLRNMAKLQPVDSDDFSHASKVNNDSIEEDLIPR